MDPIRAASVRLLYQTMRNSGISGMVVTLTMVGTAWPFSDHWVIAAWTIVQCITQLLREVLVRAWKRSEPHDTDYERWAGIHVVYMALTGVVWGSTIFLFAHPDQASTIALTLCCLFGMGSGSVASQAPNPPSLYAMLVPMFGAVVIRLFATENFAYILLASASAAFAVMMTRFCRAQCRTISEGFRIRFENVALVQALTLEKAAAEKARHEAESASLAKSQFLAAASHDLRQPLYALSLFSASLGTLQLDDDGRKVVGNIQDSISAMESLFVGLLDVSRLDAGVVQPRLGPVSVNELFDRLSQVFLPIAIERGLELRFRCDGEWVHSDFTLLEQVLSNLVSNALRCTSRGAVLVAARTRGGSVRFEVWDTGIGIREVDQQRIFEEFVQVDNPERDRRKGLGLGLSIARRSAELIGGTIALTSRPDRGSRFTVAQPLATSPARPIVSQAAPDVSVSRAVDGNRPVLIIDDDRDVRSALGDLLRRWDVRFDSVSTPEAALKLIDDGAKYGVVLADYRLPGPMNGLQLIDEITRRHADPAPVSHLITGDFDPQLMSSAKSQGVRLHHKPLSTDTLRGLVSAS